MLLAEYLISKGYAQATSCPLDGQYHRFDHAGALSGWFKGREVLGTASVAFGDFKIGERFDFISGEANLSPDSLAKLRAELALVAEEELADRRKLQEEVALDCDAAWNSAITRGTTPYLKRKGLKNLYGARICPDYPDTLMIPLRDITGKIWTIQRILPEKLESGLDKLMKKGGRIEACFHLIGALPTEVVYVCEGFATGASIFDALGAGSSVICAFNAGNLAPVCTSLRESKPELRIVVCGDDDVWTLRNGKPYNPGREKAEAAALAVGGSVVLPVFASLDGKPTDFNDLAAREGLARVKECLLSPKKEEPQQAGAGFNPLAIQPLPFRVTKLGVRLPASQQQIVDHAIAFFAGRLMKQDRDLFYYIGTHWQLLTLMDQDRLRVMIQKVCQGFADVKHIDSAYRLFIYHLPTPPPFVDFFVPHPFCVNFQNGTLHLRKEGRGFKMEFLNHSRQDFLTCILPYEYRAGDQEKNAEFEGMLERVFLGDSDKGDKIRAVRQMYGACLLPAFPRLFMLHGKPGTGKSTVINIAARLVHKDNLCSVPPSQWTGFNMEGMAMKLVNVDTDIPLQEPINDDLVKKIIERKPFRIRRKGIKDLSAPIPAIHLFGGNDLPKTLDGASRAHTRRWTFLEFKAFVPQGNYDQFYWDFCFDQSPQGVLNFALAGLKDLCASGGHFLNPASGVEAIEEMQDRNDMVARFLKDIQEGEMPDQYNKWELAPTARVERKEAWRGFQTWYKEVYCTEPKMGRSVFFNALRSKMGQEIKSDGVYYVPGIGVRGEGSGAF